MPIDLTLPAQVAEVLGGIAVVIAVLQLYFEFKRRSREKATQVMVWAAASTDRAEFTGLRGVVIENGTGSVIENVGIEIEARAGGTALPLADVYPTVPPGRHFLTLIDKDADAEPDGYVLIQAGSMDDGVCVNLPAASTSADGATFDLVPWHNPDLENDRRICNTFTFDLAGQTWQHRTNALKRLKGDDVQALAGARRKGEEAARRFPSVAIRKEVRAAEATANASERQRMKDLMDAVAAELWVTPPKGDETQAALKPAWQLPQVSLRRSVGMGVELYVDGRRAYWFAPNKYGHVPDVFSRAADADAYFSKGKSLKGDPAFPKGKTDWKPAELADALVSVIRADLKAALEKGEVRGKS